MNYTYNNHLYYTIGNRKFGYRETPYEKFKVFTGKIDHDVYRRSSWREELRKTASIVLNEYGKDLVLFLSGGTDSEIVLRNFLEIGFKPRCAIIKFKDDYNISDVNEAIELTTLLDVKLDIIEFDVKEFWRSGEATEFSLEIDCTQVTYLMVYYHIKKLGFPAVMGGEQFLKRHISAGNSIWYHCFRENEDASAMRFSEKYRIPLVNEWFSYTPEMMLYYLEDPDVQALITDRFNYKLTSVSSKNLILKKLYPDIKLRIKTHGFERLLGFNSEVYSTLRTQTIPRLEPSLDGIFIPDLILHLKGSL
jgi:hypothetical protein